MYQISKDEISDKLHDIGAQQQGSAPPSCSLNSKASFCTFILQGSYVDFHF